MKKGIVHDVSVHAPGIDIDPIVDETGKEQVGKRTKRWLRQGKAARRN